VVVIGNRREGILMCHELLNYILMALARLSYVVMVLYEHRVACLFNYIGLMDEKDLLFCFLLDHLGLWLHKRFLCYEGQLSGLREVWEGKRRCGIVAGW
jgi:hypothetical protein